MTLFIFQELDSLIKRQCLYIESENRIDRKLSPVLNEVMIKAIKDEHLYKVFAGAFHEVVEPHLEEIKTGLDKVELSLDKVEAKLDKIDDRLDRHGTTLDNHEKRISSLEEAPLVH